MPSFFQTTLYAGFPFAIPGDDHDVGNKGIYSGIVNNSLVATTQKMQGKTYKASVNGQLSIATIFSNALQLPSFPKSSFAIIQNGQLGLTFSQIDLISRRLGLVISSLVIPPGSEHQVSSNSDGDSVVILILDEEDYIDEQIVVLIFAILRLGATYMVVNKKDISFEAKYWKQLLTLIEPILVITLGDPLDLPTAAKTDLTLVSREHFKDYQEEDDLNNNFMENASRSSSITDIENMVAAASSLVKKIRSSLILHPVTYKPSTIAIKVLWDLSMDLRIDNEKELQIIPFRSEILLGQRTAFIFPCSPSNYWCRLGHKAIRNRMSWERIEFPIKQSEKICLTFPLQDPRSLVQIFTSFIHGKVLVLGETGEFHNGGFFLRKIRSESFKNVMRIELTPDRLKELLDTASQTAMESYLSKIRLWIVSGTYFTASLAKYFFNVVKSNQVSLVFTYGKAECIWCATWNEFSDMEDVSKNTIQKKGYPPKLSVGIPIINTTIFIVDEQKYQFCSMGQKGTICIVGGMVPSSGYCGAPVLGRGNIAFETGDLGRIVQDKKGDLRLIVEATKDLPVMLKGKMVDFDELTTQMKQSSRVKDCHTFICQRGRDEPEIVMAVSTHEAMSLNQIQELVDGQDSPLPISSLPLATIPKLHDGQIDMRQLRAEYFKFMGRCNPKQWTLLMPAKTGGSKSRKSGGNNEEVVFEKCIQVVCKAVAFSLGRLISEITENFENSFWDIGGTPLRAIMTVKSCLCQGKKLSIEDFIKAKTISELSSRLALAEKDDDQWNQDNVMTKQSFIYSRLTKSDNAELRRILMDNFSKIFLLDQKGAEKYVTTLLDLFDNSLSAVALIAHTREIVGIAFNYRGLLRSHFIPRKLEEGFELVNSMMQSCKHLTKGIDSKLLAKSYLVSLITSPITSSGRALNSTQVIILLRDLISESMKNAVSGGCKGFIVCTVDSLLQEICCGLLGFETLSEIQLNTYKNKKLQKPFVHFDDHQVIGVYFKKLYDHHQYN